MEQYKNKTLEELLEIRNELVEAWIIQKSDYQIKQLTQISLYIYYKIQNEKLLDMSQVDSMTIIQILEKAKPTL